MIAPAPAAAPDRLPPFFQRIALQNVDSTNHYALTLAEKGAPEGTLVTAETQSGGRGRRGRAWQSPPGNLYVSLILRPRQGMAAIAQLSFVAVLALAEAIRQLAPDLNLALKWPNDVLVEGAKISGILLESRATADNPWLVIGTGVNIAHAPDNTERPAISLHQVGASEITIEAMLSAYMQQLLQLYRQWQDQGFAPIAAQWKQNALGLGEKIEVRLVERQLSGIFCDLNNDGALLLETPSGVQAISAGEVYFRQSGDDDAIGH